MWHVWEKGKVRTGFWWGSDHLKDLGMAGSIILKWIFKTWNGGAWTRLLWLRTGSGGWRLWKRKWMFRFH